ncbi:MAG: ABC transporter ATP-binding protein [Lachnospiraceae bacterium]|nr:ABC transporter ATP-binding protein [Lachnospiraceae bacterium]
MKRWFKYVKPYWPWFVLGPVCMIIEVIGEVRMPTFLQAVINAANDGTLTAAMGWRAMGGMVLNALIMMAGGVGGAYFGAKAQVNFAADLRADIYARIQTFSFSNIDKFSTGSLVTRMTNDVTQVTNFVGMMLRMMLRAPGMMIAALIMAISIRPKLSLVFAVSIPLLLIGVAIVLSIGFPRFKRMQEKIDGINAAVRENVTNVRVVKSFVREDFEEEKFGKANRELRDANISAVKVMITTQPLMTLLMQGTILALVLIGGPIILRGEMPVGDLSAFITYAMQILTSLLMMSFMLMFSSRAMASGKRILEVLEEESDITDGTAAAGEPADGLTDGAPASAPRVTRGAIEFRGVTFRYYKTSEDAVLNHIDLTIPAGATVGITGATGCGKSTLVSLIPRLYDPDEGCVLVDGVDVKDYHLHDLRDDVSMVLQNNTLFSGTIADNLRWGDQNATDEDIRRAAAFAQADKFIDSFPDGYDTIIEQGGTNVSGGQKQRLCIARALLKKPKILILDDSTSAVDTATEAMIRKAFREELQDSTKLIISQRITSVMDADLILVMEEGRITASGTHAELLRTSQTYREICESQLEGKEVS